MQAFEQPRFEPKPFAGRHGTYITYGTPDSRSPLILLHGISMSPNLWGELPHELGRYTIALGRPAGKNAPTVPTIGRYAKKVISSIDEIVGENSYDLLGLSWGGLLAQQVALDDRNRIRKLVLAGTLPAAPLPLIEPPNLRAIKSIWSTSRSTDSIGTIYGGDAKNNPHAAADMAHLVQRPIDPADHIRQLVAGMFCGTLMLRQFAASNHPDTLIIAGDDDPIVPHKMVALGARALGMKLHTVTDGGHGFLLTRPRESSEIINQFLDKE